MNFRITDTRNGRSIKTFELAQPPTEEYLKELKHRLGIAKNVPTDVMELSEYKAWKKKKKN